MSGRPWRWSSRPSLPSFQRRRRPRSSHGRRRRHRCRRVALRKPVRQRRRVPLRLSRVQVRPAWATPWAAFPVSRVLRRSRTNGVHPNDRPPPPPKQDRPAVQHRRRDAARYARRRCRIDLPAWGQIRARALKLTISAATTPEPWSILMPDWPRTCPSPKAASGSCRRPSPSAGACSRSCSLMLAAFVALSPKTVVSVLPGAAQLYAMMGKPVNRWAQNRECSLDVERRRRPARAASRWRHRQPHGKRGQRADCGGGFAGQCRQGADAGHGQRAARSAPAPRSSFTVQIPSPPENVSSLKVSFAKPK